MALPVVKQCCCGCTLENGSKIIAWLQIVGGVLTLITAIVAEVGRSGTSEYQSEGYTGSSVSEFLGGILNIIFGFVLLTGIRKKRPDHINAWVIINLIGIILYIIIAIISTIALLVSGLIGAGVGVFIIFTIQIALTFYFTVVVSSLRKEIIAAGNIGV